MASAFDAIEAPSNWSDEAVVFDAVVVLLTGLLVQRALTARPRPLPLQAYRARLDTSMTSATSSDGASCACPLSPYHIAFALSCALVGCPVAALVVDGSGAAVSALADRGLLTGCFVVMAVCRLRVRALDAATACMWQLALLAGLPRLLVAVGPHSRQGEYWLMVPLYPIAALGLAASAVVRDDDDALTFPRAPATGLLSLRFFTSLCRAVGVLAIAAKCDGSYGAGQWRWSQTLLPLLMANALQLASAAVVATTLVQQRLARLKPQRRVRGCTSPAALPAVADTAWLVRYTSAAVAQCGSVGGVGGGVFTLLLALHLDGVVSLSPWTIASPVVAQVAVVALAWVAVTFHVTSPGVAPVGATAWFPTACVVSGLGAVCSVGAVVLFVAQLTRWQGVDVSWFVVFGAAWLEVVGVLCLVALALTLWSRHTPLVSAAAMHCPCGGL